MVRRQGPPPSTATVCSLLQETGGSSGDPPGWTLSPLLTFSGSVSKSPASLSLTFLVWL